MDTQHRTSSLTVNIPRLVEHVAIALPLGVLLVAGGSLLGSVAIGAMGEPVPPLPVLLCIVSPAVAFGLLPPFLATLALR